jgi:hypothetical protein
MVFLFATEFLAKPYNRISRFYPFLVPIQGVMTTQHPLQKILAERIAIIDGATGTTIRTYGMKEADIRGERFKLRTPKRIY